MPKLDCVLITLAQWNPGNRSLLLCYEECSGSTTLLSWNNGIQSLQSCPTLLQCYIFSPALIDIHRAWINGQMWNWKFGVTSRWNRLRLCLTAGWVKTEGRGRIRWGSREGTYWIPDSSIFSAWQGSFYCTVMNDAREVILSLRSTLPHLPLFFRVNLQRLTGTDWFRLGKTLSDTYAHMHAQSHTHTHTRTHSFCLPFFPSWMLISVSY